MRFVLAAVTLAAAATGAPRVASHAPPARVVTITARDYAFDAPDTIPAGLTSFRLVNRGPELHHVQLIRLEAGKTMADFLGALRQGGPPPGWAHDVGGPNTPVPGGESNTAVELAPGRYAIACFIPSPDGKPHFVKGMVRELIVAPARSASTRGARTVTPPARRTTMTLSDYDFTLSAPLVAGAQTVRVRNVAAQAHEVLFVRLQPGKTAAQAAAWAEKPEGPPPGAPVGGTTGIRRGGWNDVSLTLEPGEYALLCFLPDAKDGKPHVAHGMMKQFRVGPTRSASTSGATRIGASRASHSH